MRKHPPPLPEHFEKLGVSLPLLEALREMAFVNPSDIQSALIPVALTGRDILGQARTGTGKTTAFGIPILQGISPEGGLQGLCLVPTRELAVQVTAELTRLAQFAHLKVVAIYGGERVAKQLHDLGRRHHVVVGTPGRVMDFMGRGQLKFHQVRFVVLDEVDRMLDIGFRDDIRKILQEVPADRQTIFVSATIDGEIKKLAERYMRNPAEINVSRDELTVDAIDQSYLSVEPFDKYNVLRLILQQENPEVCIVFTNTKHVARKVTKKLHADGFNAREIHGDLIQSKRDRVMESLRKGKVRILVATDLAARGIDVNNITHIINYDLPQDPEVYVHRIGRTARMGAQGVAIMFVTLEQGKELTTVEKLINREIPRRSVEGFEPSYGGGRDRAAKPLVPLYPAADPRGGEPSPAPQRSASAGAVPSTSEPSRNAAPAQPSKPGTAPRRTLGGKFKPSRRSR